MSCQSEKAALPLPSIYFFYFLFASLSTVFLERAKLLERLVERKESWSGKGCLQTLRIGLGTLKSRSL
jgi:hypothetical protein